MLKYTQTFQRKAMKHLYEQLKYFYLGLDQKTSSPLLYENKDLSTHALIIGMTGSGKTGLGIGLIEEATIDNIPSFIIDPKGDMGNLLLSFPNMQGKDFEPWIDKSEVGKVELKAYAKKQAKTWKKGLENSHQDLERVEKFKQSGDFTIYTPGSNAGVSIALLSTLKAPSQSIKENYELFSNITSSLVTSILNLIDVKSDPLSGKEHILLNSILIHYFSRSQDLSMEEFIAKIVQPPFEKLGAFPLNTFFPQEKRLALALKLNSLQASPSFKPWMQGEELNIEKMLFSSEGKAKVNIFYIAHLNEKERMFFVSLLLNSFLSWMRTGEGSSRLKALLYMDEIFGFFPPSKNPPSKKPMLTLLKQARSYGVGVVLSTQNPVDLDYKGLSNIGTWFIGRLQTKQDKARVIDGLQGIKGSKFSKAELMKLLSNIKKRNFLLKNIHEEGLRIFSTRWVLSYLKGPLSKKQIKSLMREKRLKKSELKSQELSPEIQPKKAKTSATKPILSEDIEQNYLYYSQSDAYFLAPFLLGSSKIRFVNTSKNIEQEKEVFFKLPLDDKEINWENYEQTKQKPLEQTPRINSSFNPLPSFVSELKDLQKELKDFKNYLYQTQKIEIYTNDKLKLFSAVDESEEEFVAKVQNKLEDLKAEEIDKIKERFAKQEKSLEKKLLTATYKLEKEQGDVGEKTTDAVISIGSSILGVLFGRSLVSRTNIAGVGRGVKSASRILKEKKDVKVAQQKVDDINEELDALASQLEEKLDALDARYSLENYPLKKLSIKPRRADIFNTKMSLLWEEE